jgi:predicted RNA-binding Zn ribbon-like protein
MVLLSFCCLSLSGAAALHRQRHSAEEAQNLFRDDTAVVFKREVASVKQVQLSLGNVVEIRLRTFDREERFVLPPNDQGLRLIIPEERVPLVIVRQVGLVVVQQIFLFVANRPILDFLNTRPILAEGELLPDARALERWFIASGMVKSSRTKAIIRGWRQSTRATAFLEQLIAFRERLRDAVARIESGSSPSDAFVAEVNARMIRHPLYTSIQKRGGMIVRETSFEPTEPADLWAPIIAATADLLAETEWSRIRKCESCIVQLFDVSKKGSRRWCSMNICGNKLKVAAYQQRKRGDNS